MTVIVTILDTRPAAAMAFSRSFFFCPRGTRAPSSGTLPRASRPTLIRDDEARTVERPHSDASIHARAHRRRERRASARRLIDDVTTRHGGRFRARVSRADVHVEAMREGW